MKNVIVTGHSKGLGKALTENLLSRGVNVLGLARSELSIASETYPGDFEQFSLDLSDVPSIIDWTDSGRLQAFLGQAKEVLLINNAGIVDPVNPIGRQNATDIAHAVSINVTACLILSNAFVQATEGASDRRLVHISSGAARSAFSGWSVYCATKAALDHHARCVAEDGIPNLRIASIAPGIIDTDMQANIRSRTKAEFSLLEQFRSFKKEGALTAPEETAETLVRYLQSEAFGRNVCVDIRDL